MDRHCLFITIEGIDGAGKSTAGRLLADRVGGLYICTPDKRFAEDRAIVENTGTVHEKYEFYLSCITQVKAEVEEGLKHCPVICDRYIHSTVAYQWPLDQSIPNDLHSYFSQILWPDASFLLTVSPEVSDKRIEKRQLETGVLTGSDMNKPLRELATARFYQMGDLIHVDSSFLTPDEVSAEMHMRAFS